MAIFDQTRMYLRFAFGLRGFLREPITAEWGWELTRHRLVHREKNLLAVAKKCIYENESSPYLKLLRLAGCEYGDFEKMVCSDGIERLLATALQKQMQVRSFPMSIRAIRSPSSAEGVKTQMVVP